MSQLEELKRIIVGDNAEELAELKARIENRDQRTEDVAEVLAPAILRGIEKDQHLSAAFEKPVADGLNKAVRKDTENIANALYPVMAPAIRRAISEAISSLLITINQTIESATTVGGFRTRFESFRTGVPYAELTLRKSLLYRVEQVFLIDRTSGLLISDLANESVETLDSDGVSAMFSAIQSFVQDSFSQNEEDRLTDLTVGEHRVWVVHGPKAMLACVIRGEAPASLKAILHDALDSIRRDFARPISEFNGDPSAFVGIDEYLKPCLQLSLKESEAERKRSLSAILALTVFTLLLLFFLYSYFSKIHQLQKARALLDQTPGLVVTNADWQDGKLKVVGLLDPVAELPEPQLKELGIAADEIELSTKPFQSLENEIIVERFRQRTQMPETVGVTYSLIDDGSSIIKLEGSVDQNWLLQYYDSLALASQASEIDANDLEVDAAAIKAILNREIFSVYEVDESAFRLSKKGTTFVVSGDFSEPVKRDIIQFNQRLPWLDIQTEYSIDIQQYLLELNSDNVIEFREGLILTRDGTRSTKQLLTRLRELQSRTPPSSKFNMVIQGHTDGLSQDRANVTLRKQRADFLYQRLIQAGLSEERFNFELLDKFDSLLKVRSVEFQISLKP